MEEALNLIKEELLVMLIAATPISELRGAIPIGITFGFSPVESTLLSIVGNSLPVPFLLKLLKPLFRYFGETRAFGGMVTWIKKRTLKRSAKVRKYSILGLFLLVAIPLPTTGAWTGCIAASLLDIKFKYALPSIIAGIITAGVIVFALSSVGVKVFF